MLSMGVESPLHELPLAPLLRDIVGNPFRPLERHRLYRTGDQDAPSVIMDRNGYVVLDLCRDCGKGESELSEPCFYVTDTVTRLAQSSYDERDPAGRLEWDRLAVLADPLEEAGCDNDTLLAALRSEGPYYRGFWALDLVLGKK